MMTNYTAGFWIWNFLNLMSYFYVRPNFISNQSKNKFCGKMILGRFSDGLGAVLGAQKVAVSAHRPTLARAFTTRFSGPFLDRFGADPGFQISNGGTPGQR